MHWFYFSGNFIDYIERYFIFLIFLNLDQFPSILKLTNTMKLRTDCLEQNFSTNAQLTVNCLILESLKTF